MSDSNTPKINRITPFTGLPGTLVSVEGNFRTGCYLRDVEECADDSGARITRLYVGGQQCQMINTTSNELYHEVTQYLIKCYVNKPEVGYFRTSMLVSNQYGRSETSKDVFYVAPDENLYNFQTYAGMIYDMFSSNAYKNTVTFEMCQIEIDSVSPQVGSTEGATRITITGKYLYTDSNVPAAIDIAGRPCAVIDFDMSDLMATRIVCESPASVSMPADNYGNRGVTLITENVLVLAANFGK